MKTVAAKPKTTKTKPHVATTTPDTATATHPACSNCARLLSTLILALPETDPLRRQLPPKAPVEGETRVPWPARMQAIEGFAEEATEAMGKLALAFAQLASAGDILDDELSVEIQQAIGLVALDLRLIHDEAVAAGADGDREVPS